MRDEEKLLVTDLPRMIEVSGHFDRAPFLVCKDMFGGLPVEIAGGEISALVGQPVADLHVHDCPELYLIISPSPGGAEVDIQLENDVFLGIKSPAVFYVPARKRHRWIARKAEIGSYCLGVLLPQA